MSESCVEGIYFIRFDVDVESPKWGFGRGKMWGEEFK